MYMFSAFEMLLFSLTQWRKLHKNPSSVHVARICMSENHGFCCTQRPDIMLTKNSHNHPVSSHQMDLLQRKWSAVLIEKVKFDVYGHSV